MRAWKTATLAAALTLVSGMAMAQSYGNGDPAWADTTDPNSIPGPGTYYGPAPQFGYHSHRGYYATPGYDDYGYSNSRPYQGDWRWSSGYYGR
jgi:hypothetical protein